MSDAAVVVWSMLGSTALSGGATYVARTWIGTKLRSAIEAKYAKELEELKKELSLEREEAIERLRAGLSGDIARQQALNNTLVLRRFDAIGKIFAQLRRLHRAVQVYVTAVGQVGGDSRSAERKSVAEAQAALLLVLDEQSIFLSAPTAAQVNDVRILCEKAARLFLHMVDVAHDTPNGSNVDTWMSVVTQIEEDAPLAILMLERDLRILMGDTEPVSASDGARLRTGEAR